MMKKEEAVAAVMDNSNHGSRSSNGTLFYSDLSSGGAGTAGFYENQCSTSVRIVNNEVDVVGGELGFLEMLGVQEFQIPMGYMLDEMFQRHVLLPSSTRAVITDHHHHQVAAGLDGNKNAPETPNSSSISSASNNEGVVAESEQDKVEEDVDENGDDEVQNQQGSNKSRKQ